jgi:hypothetical protein
MRRADIHSPPGILKICSSTPGGLE